MQVVDVTEQMTDGVVPMELDKRWSLVLVHVMMVELDA